MSVYTVRLVRKEVVAKDTMAFYFEKPEGFHFKAGQYADYILVNPPQTDGEGDVRSFTLACAPCEDKLCFVTRMCDTAFKRVMEAMEIGTEVKLDGPSGNLFLKQSPQPAVFVTGGIGVTPARSIITQATHDHLDQQIYLFYSTTTIDSAVFLDEFYKYAEVNDNFHFILTTTDPAGTLVKEETGRIDSSMIKRYIPDISGANYYVTGPASMVKSLRNMLVDNGAKKRGVFTEEFEGYK